ncbi:MAG: PaaI family thioesterase [Gammaproteobacteria bacterium]|nr:PaaI family thioesterase [Gammaproteobacteria bacterium]
MAAAFQDHIPDNFCFGCGAENPDGLRIKSYWDPDGDGDTAICRYQPQAWQAAGPSTVLNGGIIATLIDCHSVCTAIADGYRQAGREIGDPPHLWYATGSLSLRYLRPARLAREVVLRAHIRERHARKTVLACCLDSDGRPCVEAELVAVRVADDWTASL